MKDDIFSLGPFQVSVIVKCNNFKNISKSFTPTIKKTQHFLFVEISTLVISSSKEYPKERHSDKTRVLVGVIFIFHLN
jgi:hypothetical protein